MSQVIEWEMWQGEFAGVEDSIEPSVCEWQVLLIGKRHINVDGEQNADGKCASDNEEIRPRRMYKCLSAFLSD